MDKYSATTGFVHKINLLRRPKHDELCVFSDLDPTLSAISSFLNAGKPNWFVGLGVMMRSYEPLY